MATTTTQPVLVYNRISQNRRKTWLLVVFAVLSIIPFIGGISFSAAAYTVSRFGHHSISQSDEERLRQEYWKEAGPGYQAEMERQWEGIERLRQARAEDVRLLWRVMPVYALAITAVLGLLFWSLASSPTSQVLAMCGARPASPAESEAKRLLENLAIGAGLPPPKLYVIDTPVPNAFAAGMDPLHSVVAVTQGLLALLDQRELEGVLAHELSHIGNRDTRLNTIVTTIVLFLRMPYLVRRRGINERREALSQGRAVNSRFRFSRLLMLPVYVYVFFIAPFLAAVMRAAISRTREFLADADAALLTRNPEGLLRALAKIRGAGSAGSESSVAIAHLYFSDPSKPSPLMRMLGSNLLATHPPIEVRMNRLMQFSGGVPISVLEGAARAGVEFARAHPDSKGPMMAIGVQDELSVLTAGNSMGRVYRVLSATILYDQPDLQSAKLARITEGTLLVIFDDPGKFRQALTHDQTFGYLPASVKLQPVDMLPAEIHDPAARAAAQAAAVAAQAAAQASIGSSRGLTSQQIAIIALFGAFLFAAIFLALMKFGGS